MCEHDYDLSDIDNLQTAKLILESNSPIQEKMRALFFCRNVITVESVKILSDALYKNTSQLLLHEINYVLGQMRLVESKNTLIDVLNDPKVDEVTRHEAGEALGNYGELELIPILSKYLNDESAPLSETCYIAIKKIEEMEVIRQKNKKEKKDLTIEGNKNQKAENIEKNISKIIQNEIEETASTEHSNEDELSQFNSRDPAIPLFKEFNTQNLKKAIEILESDPCLYQKYKAMFFLRDNDCLEAKDALIRAYEQKSALLKHELAFIMGQMRLIEAVQALYKVMSDKNEHGMVRHEAAGALGAIGTDECKKYLTEFINDPCDILRESVVVALDVWEYENNEEVEYAKVK